MKQNLIQDGYLYYFPKGRQVKIFERNGLEIKPGDRYKGVFDVSISILKIIGYFYFVPLFIVI